MKKCAICAASILAISTSQSLAAQEVDAIPFSPQVIAACETVTSGSEETLLHSCFPNQDAKFYARTFVYFSVEGTDLNALIEESGRKRSFLQSLKALFIQNNDTAHFIVRSTGRDSSGQLVNVARYPLLTIRKRGNRDYHITRFAKLGSLSTRFVADRLSQVDSEIVVVLERESESRVLELLAGASRLVGVRLPMPGEADLSPEQKILQTLDDEISKFLSFKSRFRTLTDFGFDPGDANAFQTSAVLGTFLPDKARPKLILAAYPEQSIFGSASEFKGKSQEEMARPGGLTAAQVLEAEIDGKSISSHLLTRLSRESYSALKYGAAEAEYENACRELSNWLDNDGLALTGEDASRVQWALMSGSSVLEKESHRSLSCVSALEPRWSQLGLGLPSVAEEPLPDEHWLVLDNALSEVEQANQIVSRAVDARDAAKALSEAARKGSEPALFDGQLNSMYRYSGSAIGADQKANGVLTELSSSRQGNTYVGTFIVANSRIMYQGLGQYTATSEGNGVSFQSYTGQFEGDWGTGHGRIIYFDGSKYIGQTSREKPHGFGSLTGLGGSTIYARFVDGEAVGRAVSVGADGKRKPGSMVGGRFRPRD